MKYYLKSQLFAGVLSLGLAGWAGADEHKKMSTDGEMAKGEAACFISTETITGKEVWDFNGNMIGSIDSVLVEPAGGKSLLVVDANEWLDENPRLIVPLERFHVKPKEGDPETMIYTLNTTEEEIKAAPPYMDVTDPEAYDQSDLRSVYDYWEMKSESAAEATGSAVRDAAAATGRALGNAAEATGQAVENAADAVDESMDEVTDGE